MNESVSLRLSPILVNHVYLRHSSVGIDMVKKGVEASRIARVSTNEGNSADELRTLLVIKPFSSRGASWGKHIVVHECLLVTLLPPRFELFPRKGTTQVDATPAGSHPVSGSPLWVTPWTERGLPCHDARPGCRMGWSLSRPPSKFRLCYASSRILFHGLEQAGKMRLGVDGLDHSPRATWVFAFPGGSQEGWSRRRPASPDTAG